MHNILESNNPSTEIATIMEINHNKVPATTSLQISEIFEKLHKDVIEKLKLLAIEGDFEAERNFTLSYYVDKSGKKNKFYILDETFATFIIMKFTGKKAVEWQKKYILKFQELRTSLDSRTNEEKILSLYISKEKNVWTKTFPDEYFRQLCRLRGIPFDKGSYPSYFGHLNNNVVYERLAPLVLRKLKTTVPRNESGALSYRYHQALTKDYGCPELSSHLIGVMALMKSAFSWQEFEHRLNDVFPRYGNPPEGNLLFS